MTSLDSVVFQQEETVLARLALHQSQRCQAIPTLTVLMGQRAVAHQLWMQWLNHAHRYAAVCEYGSKAALLEAWFSTVNQHYDLQSLVIKQLAALTNQPADSLAAWLENTSEYQTELFWQQVSQVSTMAPVMRSLLAPSSSLSQPQPEESAALFEKLQVAAQLLPADSVPGILVALPGDHGEMLAIGSVLTWLTQLVEAVPIIPIGLLLARAEGMALLNHWPESRAKAIVRSGLIEVVPPDLDGLRQWLSDQGIRDQDRQQSILHLAEQYGATSESLAAAVALLDPANQPHTPEADSLYRSEAERFLFQYLEARPQTAGRFQVNAQLDINFGGRPMEVDFLDAEAKIVIELDGHFHFGSLDNYRRDRRKDRILQQQGFLILRFLSEDVVRDLETIFDAVDQLLALRQSQVINRSEA